MGTQESFESNVNEYAESDDIIIVIESGFTARGPNNTHKWYGRKMGTLTLKRNATVSSYLFKIQSLPLQEYGRPINLRTIHMGAFKPKESDLGRTLGEMGLHSGILRLEDGRKD